MDRDLALKELRADLRLANERFTAASKRLHGAVRDMQENPSPDAQTRVWVASEEYRAALAVHNLALKRLNHLLINGTPLPEEGPDI